MRQLNPRARAALILAQLRAGKGSLSSLIQSRASNSDEALIQELCFGTCRYFQELEYLASSLMDKPLRNKDDDIACLILIGLYQLRHLRVPDHAAVHESVAGARMLGKPWAAGLVNAVLRNYLKNQNALSLALEAAGPEVRHSHPLWLVDLLRNDWPQDWEQILVANNQHPPMVLRVNLAKTDRATYMHELQKAGITAVEGALGPAAIILQTPCNVDVLPGFSLGMVSVQDQASQLVPPLLELAPGNRVLDACSAPGGKTAHLLESERSLTSLLALDTSRSRLAAVKENLQRLGLMAEVACGDAADPASWWDGREFDRILLDAPCSATGVIRRHPDIKLLRRPADITPFAAKQLALLEALWACLAPGGLLLYCTCSVLRQENQGVIKEFLSRESGAKYAAISADWGVKCASGRQLLPGRESSDGFYFCRLIKQ